MNEIKGEDKDKYERGDIRRRKSSFFDKNLEVKIQLEGTSRLDVFNTIGSIDLSSFVCLSLFFSQDFSLFL